MRRCVTMLVTMLVMFMFLSACSAFGGPESAALDFVKAVYQEQDFAKAKSMCCPDPDLIQLYGDDLEAAVRSLGNNSVVTNFKVTSVSEQEVTSADEANGITGRVKVRVSFAYKSDRTSGRYWDEDKGVVMLKRHGRWCVGFF